MLAMRLRICRLKTKAGWTLENLSERSGLSVSVLSRLQSGKQRFRQTHVEALVEAFQIEPAELFEGTTDTEKAQAMTSMFASLSEESQDTVLIFLKVLAEQMKAQQAPE